MLVFDSSEGRWKLNFQFYCHFCHALFAFKHLIINWIRKVLKVTATIIKTKLGVYRNNMGSVCKYNAHHTSLFSLLSRTVAFVMLSRMKAEFMCRWWLVLMRVCCLIIIKWQVHWKGREVFYKVFSMGGSPILP